MFTRELVGVKEYNYTCSCGYDRNIATDCKCPNCKMFQVHPIPECPKCNKKFEEPLIVDIKNDKDKRVKTNA